MFTRSAAPRVLWRQGLHGLLGPGEGAARGPLRAQMRKLQWGSLAGHPIAGLSMGSSDGCWRDLATKAGGRSKKKDAEMISEEGCKKKASKTTKRRSVKANAGHLSWAEPAKTEEAAAVALSRDNCGGIHVILGPMFAGKSTALLQRVQDEAGTGRKVALVKSDKDTRYDLSAIVTHDGMKMPCYAVPDLATFKSKVGDKIYRELDVIGIDEAQFFPDLYEFCQHAADFEGKTVIVAGLDGDFLRRKFGSTLDLIPVADSVVKLSSRCEICGRPAVFSFRKTLDTHTELVGGAEVYMPVCRQHFVSGQVVVEAASTVIGAH